ncbi:MAG: TIGR04076 family protein [Thermovirgaceae bacterium]
MYDLRVTVESVQGFCDLPMKPGDYFEIRGSALVLPEGGHICIWALQSLMPFLPAKQRATNDPNDWIPATSRLVCPDPKGGVVYRVERIGERKQERTEEKPKTEPKRMRLVADPGVCSGCRACELACSAAHGGAYSPELSRIRITSDEKMCTDIPTVCHQCGSAPCVKVCPVGALQRDPGTGGLHLDEGLCTSCGACVNACPFGAIRMSPEVKPLVCDLCGGDPACAGRCPTGAVRVESMEGL